MYAGIKPNTDVKRSSPSSRIFNGGARLVLTFHNYTVSSSSSVELAAKKKPQQQVEKCKPKMGHCSRATHLCSLS
jgi:hypothetical protein